MIIVDTSVWIAAFRGDKAVMRFLAHLIDEDIVLMSSVTEVELMLGVKVSELKRLKQLIAPVIKVVPKAETWLEIGRMLSKIRLSGESYSIPDLIIASDARLNGAGIWSLDQDFSRMARAKIIEIYDPR